jgi:hypothetical protein
VRLLDLASDFDTTALVSVYGTVGFWSRFGFAPSAEDMTGKLLPYGADATYMVRPNRTWRSRKKETVLRVSMENGLSARPSGTRAGGLRRSRRPP